ncbi:hypothetical protein [Pseudomonas jessenii]|uniref:Uncharacterized protein n=1 Tax=Pseudomonas jessenii TaxID=77298 RepID=A0A370SWM2_PSEJE|nr:hypothetical protein [Pseudomonas jessenii]RDL24135.1 hypothetical protein DEU51_102393 [Pseudomonas jessenii]
MTVLPESAVLAKGQGNEFANLGSRLVRFGQALQEPSTTVSELAKLAGACGISLKLRAVSESGGGDEARP